MNANSDAEFTAPIGTESAYPAIDYEARHRQDAAVNAILDHHVPDRHSRVDEDESL